MRSRAQSLGLDYSHFTGQRRWSDHQLTNAVAAARSWSQVAEALGLSYGSSTTLLKGHAARLALDTTHFESMRTAPAGIELRPNLTHLPRAGSLMAAAWFTMCGCDVSWPLEPCRYDLAVHTDLGFRRVQVKTGRLSSHDSWVVNLSTGGRRRQTYDPDDIDDFFVIDGDLEFYLIPVAVVGGRQAIRVSAYEAFKLPQQ